MIGNALYSLFTLVLGESLMADSVVSAVVGLSVSSITIIFALFIVLLPFCLLIKIIKRGRKNVKKI